MIKAVIFDLDNTLVDFMHYKKVSCSAAVDAMIRFGLKLNKSDALKEIYKIYYEFGMEDDLVFQRFLSKFGKVDYRKLAHAINAYRKARQSVLVTYPNTRKTLLHLKKKGLKLAIVSDAPKLKAWLRLTAMRIDDLFDVVIALDDTGRLKPSKLPFKAALKKLKVHPSSCLMVGDNPDRDIKGGSLLGMKTCLAKYGYTGTAKNFKADFVISDIKELKDIV